MIVETPKMLIAGHIQAEWLAAILGRSQKQCNELLSVKDEWREREMVGDGERDGERDGEKEMESSRNRVSGE